MFSPVLVTPPVAMPVTLAEAKLHLRVDHSEEDALITTLINAATAHLEGATGILGVALATQTWRQDFDAFCDMMRLPFSPAASVTSFTYYDAADASVTLDPVSYRLLSDHHGPYVERVSGASWPVTGPRSAPISITAVYGAESVDPRINAAIKLMVGHWYNNREAVAEGSFADLPFAVDRLVASLRHIAL